MGDEREQNGGGASGGAATTPKGRDESGFYEPYAAFARSLRTWFIAYGIGAPVLFVSNAEAWKAVHASGCAATIAVVFLGGVAVQIFEALLYKSAMWQLYMTELDPSRGTTWFYGVAAWLAGSYAFELFLDLLTVALFAWATVLAITVLA
ncbi:MAG: hypothetical protein ABFD84_04200 [Candidatus Polarisedimenticolia bacterium]